MTCFKKITPLCIYLIALTALSACSTVPDRYAFWSDDITNVHESQAKGASNLSDVPANPDMDEAKDEREEMRERLEEDRFNAYDDQEDAYLDFREQMEVNTTTSSYDEPVFTPNSVQINYGALENPSYIYGRSAAIYGAYTQEAPASYAYQTPRQSYGRYEQEIATLMSENSSITINPLPDYEGVYAPAQDAYADAQEGQLLFDHGSSRLSDSDRAYIKDLAESLKSDYAPLRIVGHASTRVALTDPFKARLVNLKMSEKRATAVYKEFQKNGISADRLNITAHGDSVPNLPVEGLSEEAADRRVEILID